MLLNASFALDGADTKAMVHALSKNLHVFGIKDILNSQVNVHLVEKNSFCIFVEDLSYHDSLCVYYKSGTSDSEDLLHASEILLHQCYKSQKAYRLCFMTDRTCMDLFMGLNEVFGSIEYSVNMVRLTFENSGEKVAMSITQVTNSEIDGENWLDNGRHNYLSRENWVRGQIGSIADSFVQFSRWALDHEKLENPVKSGLNS